MGAGQQHGGGLENGKVEGDVGAGAGELHDGPLRWKGAHCGPCGAPAGKDGGKYRGTGQAVADVDTLPDHICGPDTLPAPIERA